MSSRRPSSKYAALDAKLAEQRGYDEVMRAIADHAQPDYDSAADAFVAALQSRYELRVSRWVLLVGTIYWLVAAPVLLQLTQWSLLALPAMVVIAPLFPTWCAKRMAARARAAIAAGSPSQDQLQIATALVARGGMRVAKRWMAGSVEEMTQTLTQMAGAVDCGTLGKHMPGCPHSRVQW